MEEGEEEVHVCMGKCILCMRNIDARLSRQLVEEQAPRQVSLLGGRLASP